MHSLVRSALRAALCSLAFALVPAAASATQSTRIDGVVVDQRGEPIAGAVVVVTSEGREHRVTTDREGRFSVDDVAEPAAVSVHAEGFSTLDHPWSAADRRFTLEPAPFGETVVVTAERSATRVGDTAASVVTVMRRELESTPSMTVDGALRSVPGFQLFRRTDSRAANPTSQGASLRGVGPSGASRTAVVMDGVPLNDPFGGWVYWSRIPRAAVERIEVARGGASSLYGSDALGGVIQVLTTQPSAPGWLTAEVSGGSHSTATGSLAAGASRDGWSGTFAAEAFDTDGYIPVDDDERGAVDRRAGSQHGTLAASLAREIGRTARVFVRGSVFREDRANGTPLQTNRTHVRELVAGANWTSESVGTFDLRAYGSAQVYDQTFSAIALDRESEALTRVQRVPAQQFGVSLQWQRPVAERHTLLAGVELREVRGASDEIGYFAGRATSASGAGGRQRTLGVYGEGIVRLGERVLVTVGARGDRWRNEDALSTSRLLPDTVTVRNFEPRNETMLSPRASAVVAVTSHVSLTASGYRAFRAPTLNELYRAFRVGNVLTLANSELRAERLTGGEVGARFDAFEGRFAARATAYWSEVTRPVANVTLSVTPELITRVRQNLGRTRSRGVELDVEARLGRDVVMTGGYAFADATVLRSEANPMLEGLRIPQVPRHYGSVEVRYDAPWRMTVAGVGRFSSAQFDDDQNQLSLAGFGVMDVYVSRSVGTMAELFVAAENVFDARVEVGRTPVTTLGAPAQVRAGIRVRVR